MSSIERLFVDLFMDAHREPLVRIALDLDATDDPLHGEQEGRNFHGYYDCYCYLPLYIFCSRHLLCAKLRSSAKDAADGAREELARTVAQFRITKCQGDLFADRTPALTMRANQLRPWLASFAYVLTCAMRLIGLAGTKLEAATCGTIRLALLKVGALVTISVRRVQLAFASACPSRDVFMLAQWRLCG